MSTQISERGLQKISDIQWTSKLRCELKLYTDVRITEEQKKYSIASSTECTKPNAKSLENNKDKRQIQNKILARRDWIFYVNQAVAQIELKEVWKATKDNDYPVKLK